MVHGSWMEVIEKRVDMVLLPVVADTSLPTFMFVHVKYAPTHMCFFSQVASVMKLTFLDVYISLLYFIILFSFLGGLSTVSCFIKSIIEPEKSRRFDVAYLIICLLCFVLGTLSPRIFRQ
ncbi:hypothetical protein MRX96_031711 [Rhipicephalus microplus]